MMARVGGICLEGLPLWLWKIRLAEWSELQVTRTDEINSSTVPRADLGGGEGKVGVVGGKQDWGFASCGLVDGKGIVGLHRRV
jgi:hypothetical protein